MKVILLKLLTICLFLSFPHKSEASRAAAQNLCTRLLSSSLISKKFAYPEEEQFYDSVSSSSEPLIAENGRLLYMSNGKPFFSGISESVEGDFIPHYQCDGRHWK